MSQSSESPPHGHGDAPIQWKDISAKIRSEQGNQRRNTVQMEI